MKHHNLPLAIPVTLALVAACDISRIDFGDASESEGFLDNGGPVRETSAVSATVTSSAETYASGTTTSDADSTTVTSETTPEATTGEDSGEPAFEGNLALLDPVCKTGFTERIYGELEDRPQCPNGVFSSDPADGEPCFWCHCVVPCDSASDCPAPATGTAEPMCISSICEWGCETDAECPDGSSCVARQAENSLLHVCAVIEDGPLECAALNFLEDPCAPYDSEETCNGQISDESTLRCHWVEERWFDAEANTSDCEAGVVEGRCLLTRELDDDELARACARSCGEVATYYEEPRGRTVGVVDLPCDLVPFGLSNTPFDGAQCGLGERDPLVCGCGAFDDCD